MAAFVAPLSLSLAPPRLSPRPRPGPTLPRSVLLGAPCFPRPRSARVLRLLRTTPPHPCMVSTHMHDATPPRDPPSPAPVATRKSPFTLAAAAFALVASVFVFSCRVRLSALLAAVTARLSSLGVLRGAIVLACINFFTVLFCFPANMGLMIGAGAVLGPLPAFLALFMSKAAAAAVAFQLARGVLYGSASRWLRRYPKLNKVLTDTGREEGWKFVLLMRLSPFPGFLLNYLLSLTGVTFAEYLFATVLGIAPSISNLVLVGATAKDVGVGVSGGTVKGGWVGFAIKAACMLSMVVVSVVVTRRARRAFAELDEEGQEKDVGDVGREAVSL